jgi:ABC-type dipeptide/oligopeptide/nickel transport system ATPase component
LSLPDYILDVCDLRTHFISNGVEVKAVDGISFRVERGHTLGLVGESGSGKSVAALSILRLINPPGKVVSGRVLFGDLDLAQLTEKEMRSIRGSRISMVFQEPMTSLNPILQVGVQISEALLAHPEVLKVSKREAWDRAIQAMRDVAIPDPERRARDYPHQLSGGMRQRVMIAMALVCRPELLIADEPTTALDVTIQAQILELLADLQKRLRLTMILISHDLGVVAEVAQTVSVMRAGKIVETGSVTDIFRKAEHPYTQSLLAAVPRLGSSKTRRDLHA